MKADIIAFVQEFFSSSIMPKGCNTSFIALIPKISNPLVVSDYRPISLIGAQYKIIAKAFGRSVSKEFLVSVSSVFLHMDGLHVRIETTQLFVGELVAVENIRNLSFILECFIVKALTHGSQVVKLISFFISSNLGLPVGFNMAATTNWDFLIDKFSKRLSNWKASMLSIGGRTTLLSSVLGSIASKVHGGLGIGSLFSLNQALILKWRWRFFQNPNALWVRVIKAVHGGPGLDNSFYSHVRDQGVWGRIAKSINAMHEKGIIPLSFLRKTVREMGTVIEVLAGCLDW
ncbi:hypothetical protein Tco_0548532 [Tanacetum coccineum]